MLNDKVSCMKEAKNTQKITGTEIENMVMEDTNLFLIDGLHCKKIN